MDCYTMTERENLLVKARLEGANKEDVNVDEIKESVLGEFRPISSAQFKRNVAQHIAEMFTLKTYDEAKGGEDE